MPQITTGLIRVHLGKEGQCQAGDALVSVNGKSTQNLALPNIIKYIGKAPRPLRMRFHRANGGGARGGDGSRDFRYAVVFNEGRIGLGLTEHKKTLFRQARSF